MVMPLALIIQQTQDSTLVRNLIPVSINEWVISHLQVTIAEIMDFGYPQNLSPEILKLYITQEGVRSPFSSKVR